MYIFIDLTKSNYQANVQIQEYLVSRIKKDNYNIKYKCLVIIKVIILDDIFNNYI